MCVYVAPFVLNRGALSPKAYDLPASPPRSHSPKPEVGASPLSRKVKRVRLQNKPRSPASKCALSFLFFFFFRNCRGMEQKEERRERRKSEWGRETLPRNEPRSQKGEERRSLVPNTRLCSPSSGGREMAESIRVAPWRTCHTHTRPLASLRPDFREMRPPHTLRSSKKAPLLPSSGSSNRARRYTKFFE